MTIDCTRSLDSLLVLIEMLLLALLLLTSVVTMMDIHKVAGLF